MEGRKGRVGGGWGGRAVGSCKWMSEATPPLFGNLAVHRMDGDYVGEPGRVSKRARPGGLPLERDDSYCLQDNYDLPASFFFSLLQQGGKAKTEPGICCHVDS